MGLGRKTTPARRMQKRRAAQRASPEKQQPTRRSARGQAAAGQENQPQNSSTGGTVNNNWMTSKASSSKASSSSSKSDSKPVKRLSSKTTKKDEKETASAPDKQIVKITIEHQLNTNSLRTFSRRASECVAALSGVAGLCSEEVKVVGLLEVVYNPEKPRRGDVAFDITIGLSDGTEAKIWTGLDKGPPRKLKFPDAETLVSAARKNM